MGQHTNRKTGHAMSLVMDGLQPAKVPSAVIAEIRSRERGGLVELAKRPPGRPGDPVRVMRRPFEGHGRAIRRHAAARACRGVVGDLGRTTSHACCRCGRDAVNSSRQKRPLCGRKFGATVAAREQVTIGVRRHLNRGVAEACLHHFERQFESAVDAAVDAPRGVEMA